MKNEHMPPVAFPSLCRFVEENLERWGPPGLVLGVLYQGEMATAGFGVTNVEHPLPVTGETLFQIGSVTKTYVGTAVMRLVEEGKLDLDATVRTHIPDFKVADESTSARVTLRQLLTHTCGWAGDDFHSTGEGDDALAAYVAQMASLEQVTPLGEVFSYNNSAFSLLGRIIEVVTERTFEEALGELVLKPLGLESSYLEPTDVMTHRFAAGHSDDGDGHQQVAHPWPLVRNNRPMGGLICHVKDLLRYAGFHLGDGTAGDGTRILGAESLDRMHAPHTTIREGEHWGLSWEVRDIDGARQVAHGGATNGHRCYLALIPEHDFAIAVYANSARGNMGIRAVHAEALKQCLGLKVPEPETIDVAEEELAAFTGFYTQQFGDLELGMLAGKLVAVHIEKSEFPGDHSMPPMSLKACGEDRLLILDGEYKNATGDIIRRSDGSIGWLRVGHRCYARHEGHKARSAILIRQNRSSQAEPTRGVSSH